MITIQELTRAQDRLDGFRSIEVTHSDRDARRLAVITLHRAENIALDGDEDQFMTLPGCTGSNLDLATLLLKAAALLLESPSQESLAARTMLEEDEPVPYSLVEKPSCQEG